MTIITVATTLSANASGALILPDDTRYTGGITLVFSSVVETLYVPLGSVNSSGDNMWSIGSNVDLSGIIEGVDSIQTPLSDGTTGSYTPTFSNPGLLDNIVGNIGADSLAGNTLANAIYGGGAWDYVYGMGGNDTLYGGTGYSDPTDMADFIFGGGGADLIYGNAGNDQINGGKELQDAVGAIEGYVAASAAADTEADGADFIYGGRGNDYILGNAGNDTIYGGGAAVDPVEGNDYLFGNAGDDYLYGNGGNDEITGGAGNDYLHGGMGDDVFIIASSAGSDTIAHFQGAGTTGGDVLRLTSNLNGSGITDLAGLLARMVTADTGVWFDLGGGNGLVIAGISTLTADDVAFV